MSRIESLFFRFLSYFGVDPASGDPAGDVRKWPETDVAAYLRSPYECEACHWGAVEIPPLETARPKPPAGPRRTDRSAPAPSAGRGRRHRSNLAVNRQPPPRGLLSS